MNPALNRSTALQLFERGNVVEICNRITFDFYPGLPQIYFTMNVNHYGQRVLHTWFHNAASYSCFAQNFILVQLASYFAQHGLQVRYPQMTHGKCMTTISVSDTATASVNIVPGYPFAHK